MILFLLLWGSPCVLAEQGTAMLLVGGINFYISPVDFTSAEIYDPKGIINCPLNISALTLGRKTLSYLRDTREILLCGGLDRRIDARCLVMKNMEFVYHSKLTQSHPKDHHTVVVNGKVWLFGGDLVHHKEGYQIESLDGATWSVEDAPLTPTVHDRGACSVFTGDALILIGGGKEEEFGWDPIPSANVSKLMPGSSNWESLTPLPAPREDHGCVYLPASDGYPQGSILVAGGTTGICEACFGDSWLYNIAEDTWIPAGEMGVSHARGSLVDVGGRILFAGGLGACGKMSWCTKGNTYRVDEFHLKNLGTQEPTWRELKTKLKSQRNYAAAAAITVDYYNDGSCSIPNPVPLNQRTPTSTTTTSTTTTIEETRCYGVYHGIACCPQLTQGDNISGREIFIQENEIRETGCQDTCKTLHPRSTGMTESKSEKYNNGKLKCWCEYGLPRLKNDNNYQTCLFRH